MLSGVAIALAVQSAAYGPAPAPKPKATAAAAEPACINQMPSKPGEIVVCAVKPDGYRINPDVLKAHKQARDHQKPKRPERYVDTSCKVVGPAGCMMAPMIDMIKVASVAATMAAKLSKGESIAPMFVTQPEPTEYELYLAAKQEREAKEEDAAAARVRAQAEAALKADKATQ